MLCYARSGGTLLNRCLGSLPNTVILSEVNPLGGGSGASVEAGSPYEQALRWYGINLSSRDFSASILELSDVCKKRGLSLIVRDWSIVNFAPMRQNGYKPPDRFLAVESLKEVCNLRTFAFVRDAIDVFLSQGMDINTFSASYLRYVNAIIDLNIPIFKYEDFCRAPETILQSICALGGIIFSKTFWNFQSFNSVNGDVQIKGSSRGGRIGNIMVLPRKRVSAKKIDTINKCDGIRVANELLGYPLRYEDVPIEPWTVMMQRKYRSLVRRLPF